VVIAPAADKLVPGGMCGPGLMAQLLTSKYVDHLPIYRQRLMFERLGVEIAESTLGSWVGLGGKLLEPLAKLMWKRARDCLVIAADDTGMRVLDADHIHGVRRGHLWVYVGYDEEGRPLWVAIRYTPDWSKAGPAKFLDGFKGTLLGDGYKGWLSLARDELIGIVLAGCMAHARRKLVEALDAKALAAAAAIALVRKLYAIEDRAREGNMSAAERLALRQAESKPIMAELKKWVDVQRLKARPKSPLGQAVTYLHNQWDALSVFLDDGRVPIDNNFVDNKVRPIALGRRNYLFCGSDEGAETAAILYTILANAKLASVDPWAWLNDILPKLAKLTSQGREPSEADLEPLLPAAWVNSRK